MPGATPVYLAYHQWNDHLIFEISIDWHRNDSTYFITFELTDGDTTVERQIEINIKVSRVKALTMSGLPMGSIIEEGQLFISTDSEVTILSADDQVLVKQLGPT